MSSPAFSAADSARFAGTYSLDAGGAITLVQRGLFLHVSGEPERFGLGMSFDGRLVVVFGPRDKVEIGAYRIDGNRLEGLWVPPGASTDECTGCGTERSIADANAGAGVHRIEHAIAIDGAAYDGTLTIAPMSGTSPDAPHPRPVTLEWKLDDGDYRSFGIAYPDAIYTTFSFEPEQRCAVAVYEPVEGETGTLRGVVLRSGDSSLTPQVIRRVASSSSSSPSPSPSSAAGDAHFMFLGLGFLLLQTKSIGDCSLYFGTTWLVSTIVITGVLFMVLIANLIAIRMRPRRRASPWLYAPLLASLAGLSATPREWVLSLPFDVRLAWALLVVPLPVLFAGLIFSTTFRAAAIASAAFGANLVGATLGGFGEYLGMATGTHALWLIVIAAYVASLGCLLVSRRTSCQPISACHPEGVAKRPRRMWPQPERPSRQ